ncbi:hypothetical protein B0H13DRAFT_2229548 [Mycena leptocephala]|nr:hypothetical protein B0H13DRAFT_2229548 [Mycena leptocephala]
MSWTRRLSSLPPSLRVSFLHPYDPTTFFAPLESPPCILTIGARILVFFHDRIWEPLLTAKRFVYLFALFMPVIICSPMLLVGKPEKRYRGDRWGAVWWYNFLLAQWAGSRADLFPSLLCDRKQIEKVFQRRFEDIFEEFDEHLLGRVYRATLKQDLIPPSYLGLDDNARAPLDPPPSVPTASVAIKVLHPHVKKTISRDLSIMSKVPVTFPRPLNMLLLDNFVHSDLHPGNIMIKFSSIFHSLFHKVAFCDSESDQIVSDLSKLIDDPPAWRAKLNELGTQGYIPEIVFIDAGLVTTLSELMVERCRSPELAIETETFALKMQHLVLSVKRKTFSLGQIKISDILTEVLKAVRDHHVKMEGDFVNTVISILLLEGIGRQLDPGLDLFKSALPILRQLGGQMAASATIESERQTGNLGAMLKMWVWLEARQLISASIVNADESVKYGW